MNYIFQISTSPHYICFSNFLLIFTTLDFSNFKLGMPNLWPSSHMWPSSAHTATHATCCYVIMVVALPHQVAWPCPGAWSECSAALTDNMALCLICKEILSVFKDYNLGRRYMQKRCQMQCIPRNASERQNCRTEKRCRLSDIFFKKSKTPTYSVIKN